MAPRLKMLMVRKTSVVCPEFRPGTQAQTYIQGIPGTENEISVGTEVSSKTATHTFTNTQLSAVRVHLKWPSLMKQEDDGDVVGNTVKYAIDLQTDGGAGRRCWKPLSRVKPPPVMSGAIVLICPR